MKLIKSLGVASLLLLMAGLAVNSWLSTWSTAVHGSVACSHVAQPSHAATSRGVPPTAWDLRVSGPYVHENLQVYLVHGNDQVHDGREILTLEEAIMRKQAIVHETDQVRELAIENLAADADVYVQAGDILQGGKQDRVLAVDLLLPPGRGRTEVASFCVEPGRWGPRVDGLAEEELAEEALAEEALLEIGEESAFVRPQSNVIADMFSSGSWFSSSHHLLPTRELKHAVKVAAAQGLVWENVQQVQKSLARRLGTGDVIAKKSASSLELTMSGDKVEEATGEYTMALSTILENHHDALGVAFVVNGQVTSADVYGSRDLFRKLWPKLLRASAVEAMIAPAAPGKPGPVGAERVLAFLAGAIGRHVSSENLTERVQLARSEGPRDFFFETRDRTRKLAWIHRSYLAR